MEVFASSVIGNQILEQTHQLQRSRLLLNLSLKNEGNKIIDKIEAKKYILSEEEKKV